MGAARIAVAVPAESTPRLRAIRTWEKGLLETGASAQSEGIHEVLHSLDAATKDFARRLDELAAADPPHAGADRSSAGAGPPGAVVDVAAAEHTDVEPYPSLGIGRANLDLDRRMADAEAEAQGYLEEAKRRADSMVQSIVNAVEAEADAMRRDAEDAIRKRWVEVEAEADRFLAEARRAADGIVENRQRRIADLSDAIVGLAGVLTERMSDGTSSPLQPMSRKAMAPTTPAATGVRIGGM